MHILFVCAEYPYTDRPTGGFGSYVKNLTLGLTSLGHQVTIICSGESRQILNRNLYSIHVLSNFKLPRSLNLLQRLVSFLNYPIFFSWSAHQEINKIIRENTINVIEGGDFGGELFFHLLLRANTRIPVVIKLHTPSFVIRKINQEKNILFFKVIESIEVFCLRRAQQLYSPTLALKALVEQKYNLQVKKIIPYPFPQIARSKDEVRQDKTVLYVGKLQSKKGVFILADAILRLLNIDNEVGFIFIGPDTRENGVSVRKLLLKKLNKKINKNTISFINEISQKALVGYYKKATLIVVPSLWENYPNVVLEAIRFKLPIVATRVGGISEILENNRSAILVLPNNSDQLAQAIAALLSSPQLQRQLSNYAYSQIIPKLSANKIAAKTLNFYESSSV